ncbi:MAG TPA: hypothetical protein O0X42_00310 [Methanocorpusculum sp.]|nr:hypothetical protein [Methanocorpusculum sp.]
MTSLEQLEARIAALEADNAALKKRVSSLELQTAQITERALRTMSSGCSTCSGGQ